MSIEAVLILILIAALTVLGRFLMERGNQVLQEIATLNAAVQGSNGHGGLLNDVSEVKEDLKAVKSDLSLVRGRLDDLEREGS